MVETYFCCKERNYPIVFEKVQLQYRVASLVDNERISGQQERHRPLVRGMMGESAGCSRLKLTGAAEDRLVLFMYRT